MVAVGTIPWAGYGRAPGDERETRGVAVRIEPANGLGVAFLERRV